MITYPFDFAAPASLGQALELLAEHGEGARPMSGGMSLMPIMNLGLATPEVIVSLNHVDDLSHVREDAGHVRIGAMVRHAGIASSPLLSGACAALPQAAAAIGDVQVRNRGTIGGSLAHADPAADYLPVLAAMDAGLVLRSTAGSREVPVRSFVLGLMDTQLGAGEIVTEVRVRRLGPSESSAYVRLARVEGSFAIANAAAVASESGITLAVGGVRPTPVVVETEDAADFQTPEALARWVADALGDLLASSRTRSDPESRYKEAMAVVCAKRAGASASGYPTRPGPRGPGAEEAA